MNCYKTFQLFYKSINVNYKINLNENTHIFQVLQKIPTVGDQKTEVRADAIIRAMSDGDTAYDRLEGLHPMFADWHLKRTFSEVSKNFMAVILLNKKQSLLLSNAKRQRIVSL